LKNEVECHDAAIYLPKVKNDIYGTDVKNARARATLDNSLSDQYNMIVMLLLTYQQ